jgi:hypothetical protein
MPEHDCTVAASRAAALFEAGRMEHDDARRIIALPSPGPCGPELCEPARDAFHDLIAVLKDQREADRAVLRQILEELRLAREARS